MSDSQASQDLLVDLSSHQDPAPSAATPTSHHEQQQQDEENIRRQTVLRPQPGEAANLLTDDHTPTSSPARNVLVITPASTLLTATTSTSTTTTGLASPVRVPGTFPPEWLPDHETDTCMACETQFTLIKRRHHCRSCGKIFCGDCCKQKARLLYMDNKEARVCNNCHNLIDYTLTISGHNGQQQQQQQQQRNSQTAGARSADGQVEGQALTPATSTTSGYNQPLSGPTGPPGSSASNCIYPAARPSTSTILKVQGVLKNSTTQAARLSGALNDLCNISNNSSSSSAAAAAADQHSTSKQVIFSDGIRPGTDLSEPSSFPHQMTTTTTTIATITTITSPHSSSSTVAESSTNASFSVPSRQNRVVVDSTDDTSVTPSGTPNDDDELDTSATNTAPSLMSPTQIPPVPPMETVRRMRASKATKNITVCDELGYLPPIVISKDAPIANTTTGGGGGGQQAADDGTGGAATSATSANSLANLILSQFKSSKKTIQASMESRSCPLNGVVKFEEISDLVGVDKVITFLLLKSFYLRVKIVKKICCVDREWCARPVTPNPEDEHIPADLSLSSEIEAATRDDQQATANELEGGGGGDGPPEYWCFLSSGLDKLGQEEIMFVLNKDKSNSCIPRDIFKIYLTLHELALRRQAIENLGNLLFQDGLFGCRDTAGLLFVKPTKDHCLKNLILPHNKFLIALVLQRWEVPWSKVFPMRLLLRLGHKYDSYPYPVISYATRDPVYYEIGHTIISILGDFRNFRYSLTHVDGLKVIVDRAAKKVTVRLYRVNYMQFSKVLDSSNNEHVLAWSAGPFSEADGHLVSVQNDEGQYETAEFFRKSSDANISFMNLETNFRLGASFIVFSGALKLKQSGQPAKISIVEDGLLVQIQSCTMSALRNAINYMHNFDIDCENAQDPLNRVEIRWQAKG